MKVKKELYEAFSPPEPRGKDGFLAALPYPKLSFGGFVLSQVRYIRKRLWFASAVILLAAVLYLCLMPREIISAINLPSVWAVSSMTPFLAMLTAAEISRSGAYGMTELEAACRFSLPQLTGARVLIIGTVSFGVTALLAALSGIFTSAGAAKAALYILAPFLLVNSISLAAYTRFRDREGSYISAAAAVAVSAAGVIFPSRGLMLPESTLNRACMLICAVGAVSMIISMKKIMGGIDLASRKGQL